MRVCVISPLINGSSIQPTSASKIDILKFIGSICCNYDFIVLAGYVNNYPNNPNNADCYPKKKAVKKLLRSKSSSATVFIESGGIKKHNYPPKQVNHKNAFFVSATKTFSMPEQIFSYKANKDDIKELNKRIQERFHNIMDKKILLLICGEIDAFTEDNNVVKHQLTLDWEIDKKDKNNVDIIINPTFTIRKRWNELNFKLRNLSNNKKIVIHNANNDKDRKQKTTTDIRVYFDGRKMSDNDIARHVVNEYNLTRASFTIL